ncbi:MAG: tetratricopeptide repeat protein [Bacteroidales bacterium]|nr:tetratricopeptide repeat protein [Bacteroidales bacterium]
MLNEVKSLRMTVKKSILVIAALLFTGILVNAQPNKRASALNYLKYGELDKAKEAIDAACKHPKTANDPRTWWYKGQIYQTIHTSDEYKLLSPDAADTAFVAFKKALLLNFKDPAMHNLDIENTYEDQMKFVNALRDRSTHYVDQSIIIDIITNRYPVLANILVNRGVKQYSEEKAYKKAQSSFEGSLFVNSLTGKIDTPVVYYAALSAEKAKDYKSAVQYFKQITKLEYGKDETEKAGMYFFLAKVYKEQKDTVHYLKTLKKGIEKYPNGSNPLVVEMINYYLSSGKSDEALNYLNVAITKDTTNPDFYYARGSLYDVNLKQSEKAIPDYKKALSLNADYFDANYNLGALYYNQAVDIIKKAQDENDNDKYSKMINKAKGVMKVALPYLEKAYSIKGTDKNTMISLKELYYRLGQVDKSKEVGDKLKELHK